VKKLLRIIALLAAAFAPIARAADVPVFPTGPVFRISGLVWGSSTASGFNQNFFFTPQNLNESVCVTVKNNNTTNPHTFSTAILITTDPSNVTPSDGTWQTGAASVSFAATSPGTPGGLGAQISGAAQVAISFTGSTVQAGSPDTANVSIVQTTGSCFSGNNSIGAGVQTVSATPSIQAISEGLSQAFSLQSGTVTNPASGQEIIGVNSNNGTRSIYLDRVVAACSAACSITVNITSTAGTTCSNPVPGNLKANSSVTSTSQGTTGCTGLPTVLVPLVGGLPLAAGTPFVLDLRGVVTPSGGVTGIDVVMAAGLTGTINASLFWYEK